MRSLKRRQVSLIVIYNLGPVTEVRETTKGQVRYKVNEEAWVVYDITLRAFGNTLEM